MTSFLERRFAPRIFVHFKLHVPSRVQRLFPQEVVMFIVNCFLAANKNTLALDPVVVEKCFQKVYSQITVKLRKQEERKRERAALNESGRAAVRGGPMTRGGRSSQGRGNDTVSIFEFFFEKL